MRRIFAFVTTSVLLGTAASAETQVFIVANNADGYGVDRCLATGASCGALVATAYCQARDFTQARSFHKIEHDEISGAIDQASTESCHGQCDDFVAIECSR